jgi:hypothetical protein
MSVDIYVAVPAAEWPTAAAVGECASRHGFPITVDRFPHFDAGKVVTDGASVTIDGSEAYLEGDLSPATLSAEQVQAINDQIASSKDPFRIGDRDALMSIHVVSPAEMRAASYVVASLLVCFHGYGFEPQGNDHGRADFANRLIEGASLLKGM